MREVVAVPAVAAAMFAEEKPALGPLPLEPFRYYQYGQRIHVQWNAAHVRLIDPHTG